MNTKTRRSPELFLDGLVEELRAMSDADALEGENPDELVKVGRRLLAAARKDAAKISPNPLPLPTES